METAGTGGQDITLNPTWVFLPKQVETLESVKKNKFTLYSGAVGAGKTLLLAHAAINACLNNPGCKGALCSLTYTQLSNVVYTVFNEELLKYQDIIDENNISQNLIVRRVASNGKMLVEFYNGSIIYFLSCDDEMKIRGYTLDFFGIDEPIDVDEKFFMQLMARLRGKEIKQRFGILTTNPGAKSHWIYQRFYTKATKDYNAIQTTTYDNVFLPKGYIRSMEEGYDDDWILRFLNGEWGSYAGQIYKNFNPDKHVGNYTNKGKPDYKNKEIKYYIAGVDWGIRNPSCILTIGVTGNREAIIVDEYYKSDKTTRDVTEELVKLNKKYDYRKIFIDPSALDLITQCQREKLPAEKGDNHVEPGIGKVKSLLSKNLIYIDKKCRNAIRELLAYTYEKEKLNQNPGEKPVKVYDHACDALRYALFTFKAWKNRCLIGMVKNHLWQIEDNIKVDENLKLLK